MRPEIRDRIARGLDIYDRDGVTPERVRFEPYTVRGDSGKKYNIRFYPDTNEWTCDCPDHRERQMTCKHIWACIMYKEAE